MRKQFYALICVAVAILLLVGCSEEEQNEAVPTSAINESSQEKPPSNIEVGISILEGGIFSIVGESSSLEVRKKPSELYEGMDYEITVDGAITNILYNYNVCNIRIFNFDVIVDGVAVLSEIVRAEMPALLPPVGEDFLHPPERSFTLKFRTDQAPKKTIDIYFDVAFQRC